MGSLSRRAFLAAAGATALSCAGPERRRRAFEVHLTFDFYDDVLFGEAAWTEERLREAVREYARRGVDAFHWIWYGGAQGGMWEKGSYFEVGSDFIRRVPDPFRVVCDEAHRIGCRAYAVLKVHDLAGGMPFANYPVGGGPRPAVGLPHLGGVGNHAHRWLREHPHVRARLHPSLIADAKEPIRAIRLWHEDDRLESPPSLRVWASDDNATWRPVAVEPRLSVRKRRPPIYAPAPETAFGEERAFSCVELAGPDVREPFVCLELAAPHPIANTLAALVEVEGPAAVTLGVVPVHRKDRPSWRDAGIAFDATYGCDLPGRGWQLQRSAGRFRVALQDRGFLGIARGRNEYLSGVVELGHPEVRAWLLGLIGEMLDAGADGIDVRPSSHTESLDWENYGFGPPVIEEFRRRHGVDLTTQPFDRAAWRRLRGDFYTQFLREASAAVRSRGREILAHMIGRMDTPADEPCWMETFWDWTAWIREKLLDGLTLSDLPGPFRARVLAESRTAGLPTYMRPSLHSADDATWASRGVAAIDRAIRDGDRGFNIYESVAVMRLARDGTLAFRAPALWARLAALPR
ncbi:MAG TPA: hypothetical protein VEJ18_18065 [Planctomycetota bacterium]|nr:hypothetical protein [Planctomycetota bacterium]